MIRFANSARFYCIKRSSQPMLPANELWNKTLQPPTDKVCVLCINNIVFKHNDLPLLIQFLHPKGNLMTRKETGLCKSQHIDVSMAVKKAKEMSLIDLPRHFPKMMENVAPEPRE